MKILKNITDSKKDLVKAGVATQTFKEVIGEPLVMTGVIVYEKEEVDKDGEIKTNIVSAIKLNDGEFITSISPTVQNSLEVITTAYDEEEIKAGIDVIVKSKKSNGGRDFLYIDLV